MAKSHSKTRRVLVAIDIAKRWNQVVVEAPVGGPVPALDELLLPNVHVELAPVTLENSPTPRT